MNTLEVTGTAGDTITEAATDAKQNLDADTALAFKDSDGSLISGLLISVETYDLKFCHGSTPVQGGLGHTLISGQTYYIRNPANIRSFNYINETNGENAVLMLTPFYGDR